MYRFIYVLLLMIFTPLVYSVGHDTCDTCHKGHGGSSEYPILNSDDVNKLCFSCHSYSGHKEGTPFLEKPGISILSSHITGDGFPVLKGRIYMGSSTEKDKSTCTDCHDPHFKEKKPYLRSESYDFRGVSTKRPSLFVYETCFKCHGGEEPFSSFRRTGIIGYRFNPSNRSSHRLSISKQMKNIPSLIGMGVSSLLDCTSCHNFIVAGKSQGPHYSQYNFLLSYDYNTQDGMPESIDSYSLCYQCHNRLSILGNESFQYHREHITGLYSIKEEMPSSKRIAESLLLKKKRSPLSGFKDNRPASCSACHDAHGSRDNPFLIEFDMRVVTSATNGITAYRSYKNRHGSCTLRCHGREHLMEEY